MSSFLSSWLLHEKVIIVLHNAECDLFKQYGGNDSFFISDRRLIHAFVSFTLLIIGFRTTVSLNF